MVPLDALSLGCMSRHRGRLPWFVTRAACVFSTNVRSCTLLWCRYVCGDLSCRVEWWSELCAAHGVEPTQALHLLTATTTPTATNSLLSVTHLNASSSSGSSSSTSASSSSSFFPDSFDDSSSASAHTTQSSVAVLTPSFSNTKPAPVSAHVPPPPPACPLFSKTAQSDSATHVSGVGVGAMLGVLHSARPLQAELLRVKSVATASFNNPMATTTANEVWVLVSTICVCTQGCGVHVRSHVILCALLVIGGETTFVLLFGDGNPETIASRARVRDPISLPCFRVRLGCGSGVLIH